MVALWSANLVMAGLPVKIEVFVAMKDSTAS